MSDSRSVILARVRQAQRTGTFPSAALVAQPFRASGDAGLKACATNVDATTTDGSTNEERFIRELDALGVKSYVEATADAVSGRVTEIVAGRSVFAWDTLPHDITIANAATGASPREVQAAAEIGVTGCDAAIAETGSLAMLTRPGKPRAASLLPPVHLAIVRRDQLRATMGEFFVERADDIASAANCTFITGPSRTADIELTLTLGVHGPGEVIIVIGP